MPAREAVPEGESEGRGGAPEGHAQAWPAGVVLRHDVKARAVRSVATQPAQPASAGEGKHGKEGTARPSARKARASARAARFRPAKASPLGRAVFRLAGDVACSQRDISGNRVRISPGNSYTLA